MYICHESPTVKTRPCSSHLNGNIALKSWARLGKIDGPIGVGDANRGQLYSPGRIYVVFGGIGRRPRVRAGTRLCPGATGRSVAAPV